MGTPGNRCTSCAPTSPAMWGRGVEGRIARCMIIHERGFGADFSARKLENASASSVSVTTQSIRAVRIASAASGILPRSLTKINEPEFLHALKSGISSCQKSGNRIITPVDLNEIRDCSHDVHFQSSGIGKPRRIGSFGLNEVGTILLEGDLFSAKNFSNLAISSGCVIGRV